MVAQLLSRPVLDTGKTRELIDGYAMDAPFRDLGEPSWFATDRERRAYWTDHATEIVTWARAHGFAHPAAAFRYGLPDAARAELWAWTA
jgi:hypothetical protein